MNANSPLYPRAALLFKGGGGPAPGTPQIPAPPAPPFTENATEVTQAKQDAKTQAKQRSGFSSTVLAGTGASNALASSTGAGKNVLLGGG